MKKPLKICCLVVATAGSQGCDDIGPTYDGVSVPTGGSSPIGGTGGLAAKGTGGTVGSGGVIGSGGFIGDWGGGGIYNGTGGSLPVTGGVGGGGAVAVSWCQAEDGSSRWIYDEDAGIAPGAPCYPAMPVDEDGGVLDWDADGGMGYDEDAGF